MGKEVDLYELFYAESVEQNEHQQSTAEIERLSVKADTPKKRASALYDLDFSQDSDVASQEPLTKRDNLLTVELASVAVKDIVQIQPFNKNAEQEIKFLENVIKRFEDVISVVMTQDKHVRFSLYDMGRITQQLGPLIGEERYYFKKYCKQHPALEYFGDDVFGLSEFITPETYWPGLVETSARIDIPSLVANTVEIMSHVNKPRGGFMLKNVLGIMKSQGYELYTDELNDFIVQLAEFEGVVPQEDGSYRVPHIPTAENEKPEKPITPRETFEVRKPRDISKAIHKINSTDEFKRAKELAINKADTRRRGRNRKSKGGQVKSRYQGKKQSFEQILAQSIQNSPQIKK